MRREDDGVLALDRVDGHVDHRDERIGHRQQAGDDAGGLGVLDDALFGQLFDDADALRAQRVAQDAEDLPAAGRHAVGAAHAALLDAHAGQPAERRLVGGRPGDRAAQPVDGRLIVVVDRRHRGARAREQLLRGRDSPPR